MTMPYAVPPTPPGFPPGPALTQSPYSVPTGAAVGPHFDSVKLDPGVFDVSSGMDPVPNGEPVPPIVETGRNLVRRYRRSLWLTDAIKVTAAEAAVATAVRPIGRCSR